MSEKKLSTIDSPIEKTQSASKILKNYKELMALGDEQKSDMCKLLRYYIVSAVGLKYCEKLNLLVKDQHLASNELSRTKFRKWFDDTLMETLDSVFEANVFDTPKTMDLLTEIIVGLYSTMEMIDDDSIEEDIDYMIEIPSQFIEMVQQSPSIPTFTRHTFYSQEDIMTGRVSVGKTEDTLSLSYKAKINKVESSW